MKYAILVTSSEFVTIENLEKTEELRTGTFGKYVILVTSSVFLTIPL